MDFDKVKENIQPLRQGRNIERLETALNAENQQDLQKELLKQRDDHEIAINNYQGSDPLELWYEYILWIEQSYPKSGKESQLDDVLIKCITKFENDERYRQDRRMVKIYMKYIDSQDNPQNFYQELWNQGVGTMVADLYIGWAYYYDAVDNFKKAEEIYRKGIDARAQPLDELEHAHKQFGFSMSQRILYKDDPGNQKEFQTTLEERRNALTSLKAHRRRHVGTIRTGLAVRNDGPGVVIQDRTRQGSSKENNSGVPVYVEDDPEISTVPRNESIVKSLVDSARARENKHEPGPWSKAKLPNKSGPLIPESQKLNFKIMEDDANFTAIPYTVKTYHLGFQPPKNFVSRNKLLPNGWDNVPLVIKETIEPKAIPMYSKMYCYPGNGVTEHQEYQPEEYYGYKWYKYHGINNKFTLKYDPIWDDKYECGIRLYPNFANKNLPQTNTTNEEMEIDPEKGFVVDYNQIRQVINGKVEGKSIEEIKAEKWKLNPKISIEPIDMDCDDLEETCIGTRRVSIMPRHSIMPDSRASINVAGNTDFRTPKIPILRKSVLPRRSIMPPVSPLSPIKDQSSVNEDEIHPIEDPVVAPIPTPKFKFEIYSDGADTSQKSTGAVKKEPQLKRKVEERDNEEIPNKNICAIETPLKYRPATPESQSEFNEFVIPKAPIVPSNPPFKIFEDDTSSTATMSLFNHNESMCTMVFNQCLDKESVSTPIHSGSKAVSRIPVIEKLQMIEQEQENISPISDPETPMETIENKCLPKQLSTIMETTEITSSTASVVNTKSSISSPDSDNDTAVKVSQSIATKSTCEGTSFTPPSSLDLCNNVTAQKKEFPLFSIYEDKTENMRAISLKGPSFSAVNDSKIDKENNSKIFMASMGPMESFKFPIIPEKSCIEDPKLVDSMTSMMSLKLTDEKSRILQSEISKIDSTKNMEHEEIPTMANSMISFQIPKEPKMVPEIQEVPEKKLSFEIYKDESSNLKEKSIKFMNSMRQESNSMVAFDTKSQHEMEAPREVYSRNKSSQQLVSFEVLKNDASTSGRKSDEFFDFFAKSPVKPGRSILFSGVDQQRKSNYSSILKFDKSDHDATAELLKLNPTDSKSVSVMAKASSRKSLLRESQIKQEKSLHIEDQLSSRFSTQSPIYGLTPEKSAMEMPQVPIFVEDDYLNTVNFASNLGYAKNSTFIAPAQGSSPHFGIFKVESGVSKQQERQKSLREKTKLSLSLDENEFMALAEEKMPESILPTPSIELMPPPPMMNLNKGPTLFPNKEIPLQINAPDTPVDDDLSHTIYVQESNNFEIPEEEWDEVHESFDVNAIDNQYYHSIVDFNATRAVIEEHLGEEILNPFEKPFLNALLENIDFRQYIESLETCTLKNKISPISKGHSVVCGAEMFDVINVIGKGAYGTVFSGKLQKTGQMFALKQERPANLWEYYICLEIQSRIANPCILKGFMSIDYALIGNNASVFASEFSKFGTIIDVCNTIKKTTNRNMDELIVMLITSQILDIIDHLHGNQIIHADIKPDNFLLMSKLDYFSSIPSVQLIDFGVAIDMKSIERIQPGVEFQLVSEENPCIEMRENKPWTYQVDLFGVAGTSHAMLFGKYMELEKKITKWEIKTKLPRYFQKDLWENFFDVLLNIRSCKEMPNLQELRAAFKAELLNKERIVLEKINEFNKIM